MRWTHLVSICLATVAVFVTEHASEPTSAQSSEASRVVAVGDIHGDLDSFIEILTAADLIDQSRRWTGRDTVLVQLGDFTDRGPQVRAVMDFLMGLERQAASARGRVEILLGNHEVMNLMGDLRYVTPEIYASFADGNSERRRQRAFEAYSTLTGTTDRAAWMTDHPPGFIEYREAFAPRGRYGAWLRRKSIVSQVGDSIFLHGGFDPAQTPGTFEMINRRAASEIKQHDGLRDRMVDRKLILPFATFEELLSAAQAAFDSLAGGLSGTPQEPGATAEAVERATRDGPWLKELLQIGSWSIVHPNGPLWFRGFATWSDTEGTAAMRVLAERYNVSRFVVGHTVTGNKRITSRFDNRAFLIDTGMSRSYVAGGIASAIEIRKEQITAIYPGSRAVLTGAAALSSTPER